MNLGTLLVIISTGTFVGTAAIVYYLVTEIGLSWRYGHSKDKWPKEAIEKVLRKTGVAYWACVFLMIFLVVAPISVYLIERGSRGGSFLAAYILIPALYAFVLARLFRGQMRYFRYLLTEKR